MSTFFLTCTFVLSFTPLWAVIFIRSIIAVYVKENNIYTEMICIAFIPAMIVFCWVVVRMILVNAGNRSVTKYRIENVEQQPFISTEYLLTCVLPLIAFDFSKWRGWIDFGVIFVFLLILFVKYHRFPANGFFELINYRFYSCEVISLRGNPYQIVIMSKDDIRANADIYIDVIRIDDRNYVTLEKIL